jgi:hypothetical protein
MAFKGTHHRGLCLKEWLAFGNKKEGAHSGFSIVKIPVSVAQCTANANAETDTGFDLESGWVVWDAWIVINTTSSHTVEVGLNHNESGGDLDGFIDNASLATAGFVYPDAVVTTGTTETYYASTTRGVLLADYNVGADDGNCNEGVYHPRPYKVGTTALSVVYKPTTGATAAFDIFLKIWNPSPTATIDTISTKTHAAAA